MHAKIRTLWDTNEAAKQALVDQAQALLEGTEDSLPSRIDQAKALQQQWKNCGPVSRNAERKLWTNFRGACDSLFSERDSAAVARAQVQSQDIAAAEQLLTEFTNSTTNLTAEAASKADLAQWRKRLNTALEALQHRDRVAMERKVETVVGDYERLLKQHSKDQIHTQIKALQQWDSVAASGTEPDAAIVELVAKLPPPPATAPTVDAMREFVLNVELRFDQPSPAEDAELRMQLQVARLQNAMGAKPANKTPEKDTGTSAPLELALQWCALSPKPDTTTTNELRERLFDALLMES